MKQKTEIVYILVTPSVGQLRSTVPTMRGVSSGFLTNSVHELPSNSGKLSIFYCNARSIITKVGQSCCHLALYICDTEKSLVDYSIVRLDSSRHGGGIILYIKNNLNFDIISHGVLGLELIFVSIFLHNNRSICLGVFL